MFPFFQNVKQFKNKFQMDNNLKNFKPKYILKLHRFMLLLNL